MGATLKSEGSGYELYETTHYQDLDVYHSGTLSHTLDQIADGNTTLERRDQEKIDLTGQLQNDQPVWTGTAYREVKGNLEYKDKFDGKYELGAYNKRDAELTKTATYRSDFDPVTRQIVNTGSNNGAQVAITGDEAIWNGGLLGPGELVVTPHTTLTDYEAALQAIFEDWDGSEVILPPDEPPPPEPDPESPTPPSFNDSTLEHLRTWSNGSFYRWLWTGDYNASDDLYEHALNVGGGVLAEQWFATVDGFVPFSDPFSDYYDSSLNRIQWSQLAGAGLRESLLIATGTTFAARIVGPQIWEKSSFIDRAIFQHLYLGVLVEGTVPASFYYAYQVASTAQTLFNVLNYYDTFEKIFNLIKE